MSLSKPNNKVQQKRVPSKMEQYLVAAHGLIEHFPGSQIALNIIDGSVGGIVRIACGRESRVPEVSDDTLPGVEVIKLDPEEIDSSII